MSFSCQRVWAIVLRNVKAEKRSSTRLMDFFFWPTMDIAIWGATSSWFAQTQNAGQPIVLVIMTGLVLWHAAMRAMYEVSVGMIEEVWNRSLVNLFATPLTMAEWMAAVMLMGLMKIFVITLFCSSLAWLLYGVNILTLGPLILVYLGLLLMFGWTIGFLGAAIIIQLGQRVGSLPWMLAYICSPFCAVYYPVEMLPQALQYFSRCIPATYVFESMRSYLLTGSILPGKLLVGFVLTMVYLGLSLWFFSKMFRNSLDKGLSRLE